MTLIERIKEGRYHQHIDDRTLVDLVVEMVRIPSLTGQEAEMAAYLIDLLGGLEWPDIRSDERFNVVARIPGKGHGPTVMLLTHTDTAPPDSMEKPFTPLIQEGGTFGKTGLVIRGRGANVPKGTLAAMILAIDRLAFGKDLLAGDLILAAVTRDLAANHDGIRDVHKGMGITADYIIVGEPTGNRAVIGARGIIHLAVEFTGVPAHAGDPAQGINPIPLMAKFLIELEQLQLSRHKEIGEATITAISIESTRNVPQTPQSCKLVLDYRSLPSDDPAIIVAQLTRIINHIAAGDTRITGNARVLRSMYPFEVPADMPLVQILLDTIKEVTGQTTMPSYIKFSSNAGYALKAMGAETVIYGPGLIADTGLNEHITVASLREAVYVYERLIRRLNRQA